jgi:NTE family protein
MSTPRIIPSSLEVALPAAIRFTLVLSGGARGFAHAGALRALEASGLRPNAVSGISMGAVVAATYVLRED